ncbi:hypothetical protein F8388_018753 [Cannabis sativa]|uniref:Protein kinase domain-containing protein n=1 Tax=Cannabis sativa TaxID=3483 RepID=A0A7J6GM96_CANSA|nr:hypothetical protein F8388_018753 [Cannabis sativa]
MVAANEVVLENEKKQGPGASLGSIKLLKALKACPRTHENGQMFVDLTLNGSRMTALEPIFNTERVSLVSQVFFICSCCSSYFSAAFVVSIDVTLGWLAEPRKRTCGVPHTPSTDRSERVNMAPEWVYNLPITSKVDVYSYGIILLGMVIGNGPTRGSDGEDVGEARPKMLINYASGQLSKECIDEIVDPLMEGNYNLREVEILIEGVLRCVEEDKDVRPTMSQVVEMGLSNEKEK